MFGSRDVPPNRVLLCGWLAEGSYSLEINLKSGCINEDSCALCNNSVESIDHLFLQCEYTNKIWNIAKNKTDSRFGDSWNDVMLGTIREGKGDGFCARMKCLVLASAVILFGKRGIVGSLKMLDIVGNMRRVK